MPINGSGRLTAVPFSIPRDKLKKKKTLTHTTASHVIVFIVFFSNFLILISLSASLNPSPQIIERISKIPTKFFFLIYSPDMHTVHTLTLKHSLVIDHLYLDNTLKYLVKYERNFLYIRIIFVYCHRKTIHDIR